MKKIYMISTAMSLLSCVVSDFSYAQTCTAAPSCEEMGYTQSASDCAGKISLRCPFDTTAYLCLELGSGDDGNGDTDDIIELMFNVADPVAVSFTYGGGSIKVDCGNGYVATGKTSNTSNVSCVWSVPGNYTLKLSGDFTYYGGSSIKPTSLVKIDKNSITKMGNICPTSKLTSLPMLPPNLKDATGMFSSCSIDFANGLELPEGLEIADDMFYGSYPIKGEVKLPSTLKSAKNMFRAGSTGSKFSVTGLENTQIKDASYMFYNVCISSISGLPPALENGNYMFYNNNCTTIMPSLPTTLSNAEYMFWTNRYISYETSGNYILPDYSNFPNLTNFKDMFAGGNKISSSKNPSWPAEAW